jgi:hypothetical protein
VSLGHACGKRPARRSERMLQSCCDAGLSYHSLLRMFNKVTHGMLHFTA